jgi:hypothetical protein
MEAILEQPKLLLWNDWKLLRAVINKVNATFQDHTVTSFVSIILLLPRKRMKNVSHGALLVHFLLCMQVCIYISAFLSISKMEPLDQELSKFGIDTTTLSSIIVQYYTRCENIPVPLSGHQSWSCERIEVTQLTIRNQMQKNGWPKFPFCIVDKKKYKDSLRKL